MYLRDVVEKIIPIYMKLDISNNNVFEFNLLIGLLIFYIYIEPVLDLSPGRLILFSRENKIYMHV